MPGEVFEISCNCGITGTVQLGSTMLDDFTHIQLLKAGINIAAKYSYFSVDNHFKIQRLESEEKFEPMNSSLISYETMKQFLTGDTKLECPYCKGYWEVVIRIRFD